MTTVQDVIKKNVRKQARVVISDDDLVGTPAQPTEPADTPAPAAEPAAAKKAAKPKPKRQPKAKPAAAAPAEPAKHPWELADPKHIQPMAFRPGADIQAMLEFICDNTPRMTKHGFVLEAVRKAAEARIAEILKAGKG